MSTKSNKGERRRVSYYLLSNDVVTEGKKPQPVLIQRTLEMDKVLYNRYQKSLAARPVRKHGDIYTVNPAFAKYRAEVVTLVSDIRGKMGTELVAEKRFELINNGQQIAKDPYYAMGRKAIVEKQLKEREALALALQNRASLVYQMNNQVAEVETDAGVISFDRATKLAL